MERCKDCYSPMVNGLCINCDEEAHIFETQRENFHEQPGDEFMKKVDEQRKKRAVRRQGV